MNEVFYAPTANQMTIAVDDLTDVTVHKDSDGTTLISIENVGTIEFFTDETPLWRAVKSE